MNAALLKYYMPHIIFFSAWLAVGVSWLYFHYRKNPHPRFRPSMGEMSMLTLMMLLVGGGISFALGGLFRTEKDLMKGIDGKPNEGAGWSSGDSGPGQKKETERERNDREDKEARRPRSTD
jgi:hypothetical protein